MQSLPLAFSGLTAADFNTPAIRISGSVYLPPLDVSTTPELTEINNMASENLFKSIGDVASNINAQTDRPEDGQPRQENVAMGFEDENREVQEVESMCMECGKNVS